MPREIAIEGNAIAQQIGDAGWRLRGDHVRHMRIDDTATCRDRIGRMLGRRIALTHSRRDPALRPHARRALAEWGSRDDGNRQRREAKRREEPRQSSTDDDDIARWIGNCFPISSPQARRKDRRSHGLEEGCDRSPWADLLKCVRTKAEPDFPARSTINRGLLE